MTADSKLSNSEKSSETSPSDTDGAKFVTLIVVDPLTLVGLGDL
jgi:hypothetical protein